MWARSIINSERVSFWHPNLIPLTQNGTVKKKNTISLSWDYDFWSAEVHFFWYFPCLSPTDRSAVWPSPGTPVIQGPKGLIPGGASFQPPPFPPLCQVTHEGESSVHRPAIDWYDWQQTSTTLLDHRGIQTQLRRQEQTQCAGPTGETFHSDLGAFLLCLNLVSQAGWFKPINMSSVVGV